MQRPQEEFLSKDLTRYQRRLDSLWRTKIYCTAFGLNLYLNPSPPVSSFGSCGHRISILFYELSILSCVVVKIATGNALAHRVQPFYVNRKMRLPIVENKYKTM